MTSDDRNRISVGVSVPPGLQIVSTFFLGFVLILAAVLAVAGFFRTIEWAPLGGTFADNAGKIAAATAAIGAPVITGFLWAVRRLEKAHNTQNDLILLEVKTLAKNFEAMNGRLDHTIGKVSDLERWRDIQEAAQKAVESNNQAWMRWVQAVGPHPPSAQPPQPGEGI